jgi:transglutaminase-like putative cysteine protease
MNRRDFMRTAGLFSAGMVLSKPAKLFSGQMPREGWRTFDVTTRVEVLKVSSETRIWLPAAMIRDTPFQRTLSNKFQAEGGMAEMTENKADALGTISAKYPAGSKPVLTLTSRVMLRDYVVDLSGSKRSVKADRAKLSHFLQPTRLVPTDGIVKETALKATGGATTDVEKARAIYEWVVDNTFRDPKVRGCGRGDIRFMLESGDMGGKCADLNALYVGMARAVGLPARHVYGQRITTSQLGYKSLGISPDKATKGQHCRVEVYLDDHGWVPVDPADVRKVVLEEPPGNLPLTNERVREARKRLFGSWEMNWMAFNYGHDVTLPGSSGPVLAYFMYPQAETGEGRVDPFDPDNFRYEISTKEL